MHPNVSQWVRMDPKTSKSSRKPQKTCENFEKLRKNFEKLRETNYKNFFHGLVAAPEKWIGWYRDRLAKEQRPQECTQEPGEIVFIPEAWWHATLNLADALAAL